jgi:hypothetical protein
MHNWQVITVILGILFAASWGVIIPVCLDFWVKLKKVYADYKAAVADGTITDAEKVVIADDTMQAIADAANIIQFLNNLISSILVVIKASKMKALKAKK